MIKYHEFKFYYSSFSVFLFSALCLIAPTGYSWGAALLFFAGLIHLVHFRKWPEIGNDGLKIVLVFLIFCAVWILEVILDQQGLRGADRPLRFLIAAISILFLIKYPPKLNYYWSGIIVGAIGVGLWATWQKIFEGVMRAGGFTHVIQFGNISMLLGFLCLAGLGWAYEQRSKFLWIFLLIVGFVMGLLGSFFSGSRGGWIAIPLILILFIYSYRHYIKKRFALIFFLLIFSFVFLIYIFPQSGVKNRITDAYSDVGLYFSDENLDTSVGLRLEMWRTSLILIPEKPIFGWGENGYKSARNDLISKEIVYSGIKKYDAVHNEYIDVFLKRGLVGFLSLIALYFIPFKIFYNYLNYDNLKVKSIALAGEILIVSFASFGLTQVMFSHNSGVMVFSFMLVIIFSVFNLNKDVYS